MITTTSTPTTRRAFLCILLLSGWIVSSGEAFCSQSVSQKSGLKVVETRLFSSSSNSKKETKRDDYCLDRRGSVFQSLAFLSGITVVAPSASWAGERAVGSAEQSCREEGNCLEKGDWDGAVGWNWGGKDRCDASDPRCGPNGQLMDEGPKGAPVPSTNDQEITNIVELAIAIGRKEQFILKLGLYGKAYPELVKQFIDFCQGGIAVVTPRNMLGEVIYAPVALKTTGVMTAVVPMQRIAFGVPTQSAAYARSVRMSKAPDEFLPQPKPTLSNIPDAQRSHDVAGLLSVAGKGIGYGGSGFESDNEAYANAFEITATGVPSMDKEGRRIIGQIMDSESMDQVARLASLPTRKGFKGVIPGQNSGPPLLKTTIEDVAVSDVPSPSES